MGSYSAPLKRFWFVLALGVVVGGAVAFVSAYELELGLPPELTAREQPTYTAGTQLEVSSTVEPYYRSAIDVPVVASGARDEEDEAPADLSEQAEPSVATLVAAANYYPYVIVGDRVRELREQLFGSVPGTVTASAIGATSTPNRVEPGRLPFIQIVASSSSPANAKRLAQTSADAFIRYVRLQQERSGIRPAQRLIVKQLRKPDRTFKVGGTSMNLPLLVFVALVGVAVGLVFLLDRLFPRRPAAVVVAAEDETARERERLVAAPGHEA